MEPNLLARRLAAALAEKATRWSTFRRAVESVGKNPHPSRLREKTMCGFAGLVVAFVVWTMIPVCSGQDHNLTLVHALWQPDPRYPEQNLATLNTHILGDNADFEFKKPTAATTFRIYWASGGSLSNKIALIHSEVVPSIAFGERFNRDDAWIPASSLVPPAGATSVIAIIDEDNHVAEWNEGDNMMVFPLAIDLLIRNRPIYAPEYSFELAPYNFKWVPIRSTTAKLYWTSGPTLDDVTSEIPIHTHPIENPLWSGGGTVVQLGSELRTEPPERTTGVLLVLDPDQVLLDTNRTNNSRFFEFPELDTKFTSVAEGNGGVNFSYVTTAISEFPIDGGWRLDWVPTRSTTAKVYWAKGPTLADVTSATPIFTHPIPGPCLPGQAVDVQVPAAMFQNPPPGTTCVLLSLDPDEERLDPDRTNNLQIVLLSEILPEAGRVVIVKGNVKVTRNGVSTPLSVDNRICIGDLVTTAPSGSFIKILFKGGTTITIGPDSELMIDEFIEGETTLLDLVKGWIRSQVIKSDDATFIIRTRSAHFGVRGTEFDVEYLESDGVGTSQVSVMSGIVEVTEIATGRMTPLMAGDTLRILSNTAAPTPSIIGGWTLPDGIGGGTAVTFLPTGEYLYFRDGDSVSDPGGHDGMERGTYVWNAATGALSATVTADTNGEWGFSHGVANQPDVLAVIGETTLGITVPGKGTITFSRAKSLALPLVGSWYVVGGTGAGGVAAVTFLADGSYYFTQDGDPGRQPTGKDGGERGSFNWDSGTGALSANAVVDTCGTWGLSHLGSNPSVVLQNNANTLVLSGGNISGAITFYRVCPFDGTFEGWKASLGLFGANAEAAATPFGDGIPNVLRYSLNLGTSYPKLGDLPRGQIVEASGTRHLEMEFRLRKNIDGAILMPQFSTTLEYWQPVPAENIHRVSDPDAGTERHVVRMPVSGPRMFLRIATMEAPN